MDNGKDHMKPALKGLGALTWFVLSIRAIYGTPPAATPHTSSTAPRIVGMMKDVMWGGQLSGQINLDTLSNKSHLYGLGPVEYLTGEIILLDGKGFKSEVLKDSSMRVTETLKLKAPFFGYANIGKWMEVPLPDSVTTIPQLEGFLNQSTKDRERPFFFKMTGTVDSAKIHVVNLPKGTKVASPQDAHLGQKDFGIRMKAVTLLGFFSTEHQAIFTHHDTFVHIHLITDDHLQMGHLDGLALRKGTAKLYLPD
jgi:acetolactate decarboxylase